MLRNGTMANIWRHRPAMLQIARLQPRMLGQAGLHRRTDLLAVMKGEHQVGPALARRRPMRSALPLDAPPDAQERVQRPVWLGLPAKLSSRSGDPGFGDAALRPPRRTAADLRHGLA